MKIIIVTIFYLLLSASVYAADTPDTKVSYAAEKAEEVIQDNSRLKLTYPTAEGNGRRTYFLDPTNDETFCAESFETLFNQNDKLGLPTAICAFTHMEKGKPFSMCYDWPSFFKWGISNKKDPITGKEMAKDDISIFSVRTRFNTNPPQYKATFLSNGNQYREKVTPLVNTLESFLNGQTKAAPIVRRAKFYTAVAKKYVTISPELAFKFAKFGLEGMPEQIEDRPEHKDIISCKASCLSISGDICVAKDKINLAIEYYYEAANLNNDNAFISLSSLYSQLGDDYVPCHIKLLEKRAAIQPNGPTLQELYKNIAYLYEKIGNQEAANAASKKIKDLNNSVRNLFKRQRTTSEQEQSIHSNATKRTRESSPQ